MDFLKALFGAKEESPAIEADEMQYIATGSGDYDFDIVGESNYQDILSAVCGGKSEAGHTRPAVVSLEPEPTNAYDKLAVRVVMAGQTVGYLSRDDAREHHEALSEAGLGGETIWCRAVIVGGWADANNTNTGAFGVKLDIDYPLEIVRGD